MATRIESEQDEPALAISTETVCRIVVKARAFEVKDARSVSDPGSNASEDRMVSVLEDQGDDPVEGELTEFIDGLSDDEQIELVALAWLGRGDGTLADWDSLCDTARAEHNERTAAYLLGMSLLSDYLEEGLSQFGRSCNDFEAEHL